MILTVEEAQRKLETVRKEAVDKFSRPAASRGLICRLPSKTDPRLLDYIYEVIFSMADTPPGEGQHSSLDAARGLIFTLPDFKAAASRVAYSEDLLTRAVSLLEGITRCRLCGSNNTTFTTRQMHSSDEAPTPMIYCASCGHRTTQTGE